MSCPVAIVIQLLKQGDQVGKRGLIDSKESYLGAFLEDFWTSLFLELFQGCLLAINYSIKYDTIHIWWFKIPLLPSSYTGRLCSSTFFIRHFQEIIFFCCFFFFFLSRDRMNILLKTQLLLTCMLLQTVKHMAVSSVIRRSLAQLEESFRKTWWYPNHSIPLLVDKTNSRSSTDKHMALNYTEFCLICS